MGGAAMREMKQQIEERKRSGDWIEYDVHQTGDPSLQPIPVRWSQTEKGTISTVAIGLPQISNSAPPKQRKKWIPLSPVTCVSMNWVQIEGTPIQLNWEANTGESCGGKTLLLEWREEDERKSLEEEENMGQPKRGPEVVVDAGLAQTGQFAFGTSIEDIFGHSWKDNRERWLWVPKHAGLNIDLGFPASARDVQKFGSRARRIVRAESRKVDSRSFASVTRDSTMDRGGGRGWRKEEEGGRRIERGHGGREEYRDRSSPLPFQEKGEQRRSEFDIDRERERGKGGAHSGWDVKNPQRDIRRDELLREEEQ